MPDNEALKEFPDVPRRFGGFCLDPLLVEEHYNETVGIFRRYAARTPEFTEEDVIAYLVTKNAVKLYGTQGEWDEFFAELRHQVVKDGAERRPPVQVSWAIRQLGEKAVYTMVTVAAPEEPKAELAPIAIAPAAEAPIKAPVAKEAAADPNQPTYDSLLRMLGQTEDGALDKSDARAAIAREFGVTLRIADSRIKAAVAAGVVKSGSRRGASVLRIPPAKVELAVGDEQPQEGNEVAQIEALEALDAYFKVVRNVMQSLAALRDISMGQPYDKLWSRSGLEEDMDYEGFKRYIRRMEVDGLVRIEKDAKLSTRTGRSKILRGSKVFAASVQVKASWKMNARENWNAMYEEALAALLEAHP